MGGKQNDQLFGKLLRKCLSREYQESSTINIQRSSLRAISLT